MNKVTIKDKTSGDPNGFIVWVGDEQMGHEFDPGKTYPDHVTAFTVAKICVSKMYQNDASISHVVIRSDCTLR